MTRLERAEEMLLQEFPDRTFEFQGADGVWSAFDRPEHIWLTDAVPAHIPEFAGFVASGGPMVPGAIAEIPGGLLVWDGATTRVEPGSESQLTGG